MRRLPNLIIGGAQKSGTTSLHRLLASHADVYFPPAPAAPQEIHFFDIDANFRKGLGWYAELFSGQRGEAFVAQTSPLYLYLPQVPGRIHAALPDVRLVFILRNPVDRAYSHYWHEVRYGWEWLPFEAALDGEAERISQSFDARRHYSYVDRGRYAAQLRRFEEHFPRSQILLLRHDDLKADVASVCRQLADFLAIDHAGFALGGETTVHHNGARMPRVPMIQRLVRPVRNRCPKVGYLVDRLNLSRASYPPMTAETRRRLVDAFESELDELQQRWNIDTRAWRGVPLAAPAAAA